METFVFNIYLADDHALVAQGISSILQSLDSKFEVKCFTNGKELFEACKLKKPDFVFLDIEMPIWDGFKTISELRSHFVSIPICMLSMQNEKSTIEKSILLGANAYVNKDSTAEELRDCMKEVARGEKYFSREVLKVLSGLKATTSPVVALTEDLSERELEILVLICDGLNPKEIGEQLFLSPRTVETHKNNIMQKIGVNSVAKLISVALKNKLVR